MLCTRWLEPLFWLGCQRELDYSDLYVHPSEADSERLLQRFNRYVHDCDVRHRPLQARDTIPGHVGLSLGRILLLV